MTTQTIDITPTWSGILPALIALLDQPNTHQFAMEELTRMAKLADYQVALVKAGAAY